MDGRSVFDPPSSFRLVWADRRMVQSSVEDQIINDGREKIKRTGHVDKV